MNNSSLAAQSVANGPASLAPPSFDGHGWLVVVNLVLMTAALVMAGTTAGGVARDWWRSRGRDGPTDPITVWRLLCFCVGMGLGLRCGAEAMALWGWNPADPAGTGWLLTLKRFIDPFSLLFGLSALAVIELSKRSMSEQLRKWPYPTDMWASLPMLKRPVMVAVLALVAAIGVVSTR